MRFIFRIWAISFAEAYDVMADELDDLDLQSDLTHDQYDYYQHGSPGTEKLTKVVIDHLKKKLNTAVAETSLKHINILIDEAIAYLEVKKCLKENKLTSVEDFDLSENVVDLPDFQVYTINPENEDDGAGSLYYFDVEYDL